MIQLPPSMQIIEQVRAAGGHDLTFATAAGMRPVDDTLDWRRRKRMAAIRKSPQQIVTMVGV